METVLDTVVFIVAVLVLFYAPGRFVFKLIKKDSNTIEDIVLSMAVGLFLVPQIYYYLGNLRLQNIFLISIAIFGFIYLIKNINSFFHSRLKYRKGGFDAEKRSVIFLLWCMILIVLVITVFVICQSGRLYPDGMRFYQANAYDSVAQLAMTEELSKNPPHEFPFYSGLPFKGYYVGSFYWQALLQKVTEINSIDIFFRYAPIFFLPLLTLLIFTSIESLTSNKKIALLATFLILLTSDLSWVFPMVDKLLPFANIQTIKFTGSLLDWIIFNPPFAYGTLIFFAGLYFLKSCCSENKRALWPALVFTGFLFGSLFEYKAFMWITVFLGLILAGIKEYFLDRKSILAKICAVTLVFSIISFLRISSDKAVSLFKFSLGYYPLSAFREMSIVCSGENVCIFIIFLSFLFFLIGSLGVKIVGLFKICEYLKKWKETSTLLLFMIFSAAFSFILANTLLLKSNYFYATYNFFAIFFLVVPIFAAEAIIGWMEKRKVFLKRVIYSGIAVIGIGSTFFSFLAYSPGYTKYKVVTKNELDAANYLRHHSEEGAVVLHNMPTKYWVSQKNHKKTWADTEGRDSFVSALTARRTVLDCPWHMRVGNFAMDLEKRQRDVKVFFETRSQKEAWDILAKYKVSYVWVDKNKGLNFPSKNILENKFYNKSIAIYRISQKER